MQECVYLMQAGSAYKIGRSNNPPRRLIELTGEAKLRYGARPVILHTIETRSSRAIEGQLKRTFKQWQDRGEWYYLPVWAVAWICEQGDPLGALPGIYASAVKERAAQRQRRDTIVPLLNAKDVAEMLGVPESTVLHWMRSKTISFVYVGALRRVYLTEAQRIKRLLDN